MIPLKDKINSGKLPGKDSTEVASVGKAVLPMKPCQGQQNAFAEWFLSVLLCAPDNVSY